MKHGLDQQTTDSGTVRQTASSLLKTNNQDTNLAKNSGNKLSKLPVQNQDSDSGRGTISLLSNKPLRVGNHCMTNMMQNLMLDRPIQASDSQRMIKHQQVPTVSSAIGYYGLNVDYQNYVKCMNNSQQEQRSVNAEKPTTFDNR